jgi:hypothetical protein
MSAVIFMPLESSNVPALKTTVSGAVARWA